MKYSIIIVGYKAIHKLEKCLLSLIANPPEKDHPDDLKASAEIILIDNSPEQLKPLEGKREFKALLRTYLGFIYEWHPENMGFAAACNRGVALSGGENIVLINPDTEVFPEWSERMSAYLKPGVGAVGPISNFVAGWQNAGLHMRPYEDHAKTARMAIKGNNHRGVETKLLIGFFCMVRREAWDKVGGMDTQFFLGCDDLDLSLRLREAGYSLVIASDVFVYHEGHASFRESSDSLILNRQCEKKLLAKLREKYGEAIPTSTELWGCEILPTHIPKPMTLSVCMIVRDEDENLRELLPQLGFADEIAIVDTKIRDYPLNEQHILDWIESTCGQDPVKYKVGLFPWNDSFADARNKALSLCTSDWVLWLDADDRVSPEDAALIRAAMDHPGPLMQAKKVHIGLMIRDHGPDGYRYAKGQPRLFPRIEGLKWEGRVHESYLPSAERLGLEQADCGNIFIDHTGYKDPDVMLKKHARNLRLMRMEEDSPMKFYHMGKNLQALGHYLESEECYRKVLEPNRWNAPLEKVFKDQVRMCMATLIITVKGKADKEIDQYLDGNDKPDALFLRAEVALNRGKVFEAEAMYKEYLSYEFIQDPHGSQQEYLQAIARGRLETIQKAREQAYAG